MSLPEPVPSRRRILVNTSLVATLLSLLAGSGAWAASTGTTALLMPQGGTAGSANGDYVSSTGPGLGTSYKYFIEVPSGLSRLEIQLYDADIGAGGTTEDTAGRDRQRSGTWDTTATYSLIDPSGTTRTPKFTTGSSTLPATSDAAWLDFYNITGNSVRDNFGTNAYTNQDGNKNWATNWTETDNGGGGATGGSVQVTGGELRLQNISGGALPSINREANLSTTLGLTQAVLTFDYRTSGTLESNGGGRDTIIAEISNNGGTSYTTLDTFTGNVVAGTATHDITAQISTNTRIRFSITNGFTNTDEFFYVDNVKITDGDLTAGHWEVLVDESAAGDDINALGVRASDGDFTSGGTELNVYYDSMNQIGVNPPASGSDSRSYTYYPYITEGCSAAQNDFDYDSNAGTVGSLGLTSRSTAFTYNLASAALSGNNAWGRATFSGWTSDTDSIDYGIWKSDYTINTYGSPASGNYSTIYLSNDLAAALPPTANPQTNSFRVYLPTDATAAPVKPYLEQQVRHDSGPNPPQVGQASKYEITVRVANPAAQAITFSASNLVTANIPGGTVLYDGAPQVSQGSVTAAPSIGGSGNITWNPGTLAAGATAILSYQVKVTPTSSGQRITVTATPGSGNGTRATFVDETGNTTQTRATYTFGPLCELAVTQGLLTEAVVSDFHATKADRGVLVEWQTASEAGTAGFYLYRWDPAAKQYRQVLADLIPAMTEAPQGATYRVLDEDASPSEPHRYVVVEKETDGRQRNHGPYRVQVDWTHDAPEIAAAYERTVRPATREGEPAGKAVFAGSTASTLLTAAAVTNVRDGVHLSIRETGLYYVSGDDIATWFGLSAGNAQSTISTGKLTLTRGDQEVAWYPALDSAKGKKAIGLFFYGKAGDDLYTRDTVYRLQRGRGTTMSEVTAGVAVPGGEAAAFPESLHLEQETLAATAIAPDPESDYWFWAFLVGGDPDFGHQVFPLDATGLSGSGGSAALAVQLQGATSTGVNGEHQVTVSLNGTPLGQTQWQGIAPKTATFAVDPTLLHETGNQVDVADAAGNGAPYSVVYVDSFDLSYPRSYTAANDALTFAPSSSAPVAVHGFSTPSISLLDVTNPASPRWLLGAIVEPDAPSGYRLRFVATSGVRYLAVATAGLKAPAAVRAWSAPDLLSSSNRADYLVVAPASFTASAQRLADRRRSQGLTTQVVTLDQIMDNFHGGSTNPHAIHDFLSWAHGNWSTPPRYVALIGEGSLDYRNILGYADSVMPPLMVQSQGGIFPSDNRIADTNGDGMPEVAIGRIPVHTPAELDAYVDKITAYENTGSPAWAANAVMLADATDGGADFSDDSEQIAALTGSTYTLGRIYLTTTPIDAARTQLFQSINSGASLIDYVGHGGLDRLSGDGLLTNADASALNNGERLPILTAMTCTVNRFAVPGVPCLGEALVKKAGGGAAAVWGPSGLSLHGEAKLLAEHFYQKAPQPGSGLLGDWVVRSLREFTALGGDGSMLDIYNLLGDPALRVRRGPAPGTSGGSTGE